jgi:SAM-dependent methyltransferase
MTQQTTTGPGGFNWLDVWRRMYDEEREQAERAMPSDSATRADFWVNQSKQFATAAQRVPQPDSFMSFVLPRLRSSDTVLDIGAGTGRYVPTLAGAAGRVLALEPSAAMRAHLEQRIADEQLSNVAVIAESWPDADVPPCDVTISAHVVYGVREIGPFLERMNRVTRRAAFLLLNAQPPASFVSSFWQRVYGEPRKPLPGLLECMNVLYQIGIPANLSLISPPSRFTYADEDEAVADIRRRLRLQDGAHDATIRDELAHVFRRAADGRLQLRNHAFSPAVIWWEHEPPETERVV